VLIVKGLEIKVKLGLERLRKKSYPWKKGFTCTCGTENMYCYSDIRVFHNCVRVRCRLPGKDLAKSVTFDIIEDFN
jgi:hypothetical protein